MYEGGMEYLYSNTTPRKSRLPFADKVVVFGIQYLLKKYLSENWNEEFFSKDIEEVLIEYHRVIDNTLGQNVIDDEKIRYLHNLGYLPVKIKALEEGSLCPIRIPFLTIVNTDPNCAWLTNYLETLFQTVIWHPITCATISHAFRLKLEEYAQLTCDDNSHVKFQAHDFSARGCQSVESSGASGIGHLLSFVGTDTIHAISMAEEYYNADVSKELVGCSVPATEHSIMQSSIQYIQLKDGLSQSDAEQKLFTNLMDKYPSGILSVVSDTYDYWRVLTSILPNLKDKIVNRDGKLVCRPDSGTPLNIICGYNVLPIRFSSEEFLSRISNRSFHETCFQNNDAILTSDGLYYDMRGGQLLPEEVKGSIEILWEIFGGTTNCKGYKVLDPHIGLIYGDSITYDAMCAIMARLTDKGFASSNIVLGIGSYTFTYNTRDTLGIAQKGTWTQINDTSLDIFKDPKTDTGMKKSAKGLLRIDKISGQYVLHEQCTPEQESGGELITVFDNGSLMVDHSLSDIRERLLHE
jgi:nicotinamide phosphoribosyltransferase